MFKIHNATDLALPALFDTDEPLFITEFADGKPLPVLGAAELQALDGSGDDTPQEGDGDHITRDETY